jgi:DNA-binding CsgD family transcriptional regulator
MTRLVGRTAERSAVSAFLDRAGPGRVLLIEGPAGVGKSALVAFAVDAAAEAGWRVRVSRPAGTETRFAYAGLTDLLADLPLRDDLPAPQRYALDVALRRVVPDAPLDPHAVTLATIAVLGDPVLLVVDDVPWLDAATAAVLSAVVRRTDRVRLLLARRTPSTGVFPWELDRHLPPGACRTLCLSGLDLADLHEFLNERTGTRLHRATAVRIHTTSAGNPFHAMHLATAGTDGLPLTGLVTARLDTVAGADREVLVAVAALAVANVDRLRAAFAPDPVDAAVERAEAAGLLTVDADGRLRFDHPLTASVAYGSVPAPLRRAVHRRLAAVEPEPEARARHLALGTLGPDAEVAAGLDRAARDARLRGASDVAAELMGMAVERTAGALGDRGVTLAEYLLEAGDAGAAADALDRVLPTLEPGPLRARARFLRATAAWYTGESGSDEHLLAGVDDAAGDPELRGRILGRLAIFCERDRPRALGYVTAAVTALEDAGAKDPLAGALCELFYAEVQAGHPPRPDLLTRALALEDPAGSPEQSTIPGIWATALDRWDEARDRYLTSLGRDRSRGDLSSEPDLLGKLAEVEIWADDWAAARSYVDAAVRSARLLGDSAADPAVRQRLLLDAHEGRVERAGAAARARAEELGAADEPLLAAAYLATAAFAAASAGAADEVLDITEESAGHFASIGVVEPLGRLDPATERMEALVHAGRLDDAERLLAEVRERLTRVPRPWLEAAWRRAAAELAIARGCAGEAVDLAEPPDGARSFDRARILVTRGRALRRARRTGAADEAFTGAAAIFDRLGALAWSARTAAERSRLGLVRPGGDGLTPTELRVARLAAGGSTNRAVADELVMSPKTVEAHLARVYRKLGIRSRAELGSLLGSGRLPAT